MKKIVLLFLIFLYSNLTFSQTPDWTNNMTCIFYSHCTSCHNPAGIAPFSLLTYSDAANNALTIRARVQDKTMPPFLADINYRQYAHQKTLTQDEIDQVTAWVNAGIPSGDTMLAPVPPIYTQGAVISNPDFTAVIPTYTLPTLTSDMYRCFVISNPFATTQYVTGFEVIPGNRAAVHHVLIFSDDTNTPVNLDNADPDPGYVSFGGTGSNNSVLIGGWVPGSEAYFLPSGMGLKITSGSRIIVQVHYPEDASGLTDSTRVNFRYSTGPVREAADVPALYHLFPSLTDGPLDIPANTVKTFHEQYTVPYDVSVLSVAPHAHLVCTSMTSFAVTPVGDTIHFETIPHWDFHWQGAYYFQKPIHIPAGSVLYGEATYDNTINNPLNPNQPPQNVHLGEATTDEMMLFYFVYVFYQPGDENIIVDTTGHLPHYLNCVSTVSGIYDPEFLSGVKIYPSPASEIINIELPSTEKFNIEIKDMQGRSVFEKKNVFGKTEINTRTFSEGIYVMHVVNGSQKEHVQKLLIAR